MIRVVYRWRVERGREEDFATWWHDGTIRIRQSQPGSLGSTLCRSTKDSEVFVGIARWQNRQDVEAFWGQASDVGFDGAVLESVEVMEELDDLGVAQSH